MRPKLLLILVIMGWATWVQAQQITPTPIPFSVPTGTTAPTDIPIVTQVPPTFTPISEGPPQIVVPAESGAINARAEPNTDSFILGQIQPGEQYPIMGRYFMWIQFQYPSSPSGYAYVFGDLVDVIGNTSQILDLTQQELPTVDPLAAAATQTSEAMRLLPGFDATQTASVREIEPPSGIRSAPEADDTLGILPTFTYPPNITPLAPTAGPLPTGAVQISSPIVGRQTEEGIAPLLPVVVFLTFGVIGFLLSLLKR